MGDAVGTHEIPQVLAGVVSTLRGRVTVYVTDKFRLRAPGS